MAEFMGCLGLALFSIGLVVTVYMVVGTAARSWHAMEDRKDNEEL